MKRKYQKLTENIMKIGEEQLQKAYNKAKLHNQRKLKQKVLGRMETWRQEQLQYK